MIAKNKSYVFIIALLSMHLHPMVHQIIPEREPFPTTLTRVRHHSVLLPKMQIESMIEHVTTGTLIALKDSFFRLVLIIPVGDHFGARGELLAAMARIRVEAVGLAKVALEMETFLVRAAAFGARVGSLA